jgi:hypothetical protein
LQLVWNTIPFRRIWGWIFLNGNVGPHISQFGIQLKEYLLACGNFVFSEDGIYWALRLAKGAVNAFVGVNNQKVRAFIKAVYRADFYTVCVFALNAVVANNKGHGLPLLSG